MAAPTNSSGTMIYWFNGQPFEGLNKTSNDEGTMKFWLNGQPGRDIFPASSSNQSLLMLGVGS